MEPSGSVAEGVSAGAALLSAVRRPARARLIPETYRQLRRWLELIVRIFFRRVEVIGLEHVPAEGGGILVAWHPNGLVDPVLILTTFPHQVVFGARHTLFKYPLLGRFVKALGTVPIYRRMDTSPDRVEEQRQRNDASLDAMADAIARGSFSALFPEGYSHDTPYLREVKTGAARLFYRSRARTPADQPAPVLIPVGLHYDHKRFFRSAVLVEFHPPLVLPPELDVTPAHDADPEEMRGLVKGLTEKIEGELKRVVMETETWELHQLLHRARKLVRAERAARAGANPGGATMDERVLGLARVWISYNHRVGTMPEIVAALKKRVTRYDRDLRTLKIEDHELDLPPATKRFGSLLLALQIVATVFLLPPFLLIGAIVNLPPAGLVAVVSRMFGREEKDMASLKLLAGIVLFPLTWAVWAWLAWRGSAGALPDFSWMPDSGIGAAAITLLLSMVGAVVLVFYFGLAVSTWRALRVRFTRSARARSLLRLKVERGRLCDELLAMAGGIELPGVVTADGRVSRTGA